MRKHAVAIMGAGFLIIILTGMATLTTSNQIPTPEPLVEAVELSESPPHTLIAPQTTAELSRIFEQYDYQWPPQKVSDVPLLILKALPADFSEISDAQQRKSLFLRSLLPIVLLENQRLLEQRELISLLLNNGTLPKAGSEHYTWLTQVAREMRIRGELTDPKVQARLLHRLDEIPLTLALAQAAIESGWGTSRFALEGNSLFGQWTYKANKGLIPENRSPEATHFVRAFTDLRASVRAYMINLNTGTAYQEFRDTRADMRDAGDQLSPILLARHLRRYSQRGMDYVEELQKIIAGRSLTQLDLTPLPLALDKLATRSDGSLPDG